MPQAQAVCPLFLEVLHIDKSIKTFNVTAFDGSSSLFFCQISEKTFYVVTISINLDGVHKIDRYMALYTNFNSMFVVDSMESCRVATLLLAQCPPATQWLTQVLAQRTPQYLHPTTVRTRTNNRIKK